MKGNGRGLEILYDLAIPENNDTETIKDDNHDNILQFKVDVIKTLTDVIRIIKKCEEKINDEISKSNVELVLKPIVRMFDTVSKVDMNKYFGDIVLNPYEIIRDFHYVEFTKGIMRSYQLYNIAKNMDSSDMYIMFYIFSVCKKAAYDLGIRSYDAETLKKVFLLSSDYWQSIPVDDCTISDEEFADSYDNDSGIQIKSVPYYVVLSTIYPSGKNTKKFNFARGEVCYSKSTHNELLEAESKREK